MNIANEQYQLIVVGGGPAGMAAALSAYNEGLRKILIVERDRVLGGILNQCIHTGFGLEYFKEVLTGPEYAFRFLQMLQGTSIETLTDTMVLKIDCGVTGGTARNLKAVHSVHIAGKVSGYAVLQARSVIMATGCRERARGSLGIPGTRPAGVITAGTAQRYVNLEGYMPGRRIVIVGSGDVGLIMARRMTLEGASVLAVVEIMPRPGGLVRNVIQCLHDFDIPLLLSHTVTDIQGRARVDRVLVSKVDKKRNVIPGTAKAYDCDTVLLSAGLIPENELAKAAGIALDGKNTETSVSGIFCCGNALHVHDIADNVTVEAYRAGQQAAMYAGGSHA